MLILKGNEIVDRYILKLTAPIVLKGLGVLLVAHAITAVSYFAIKQPEFTGMDRQNTASIGMISPLSFHPRQIGLIDQDYVPLLEEDKGKQLCFGEVTGEFGTSFVVRHVHCGFDSGSKTYESRRDITFHRMPFADRITIPRGKIYPVVYKAGSDTMKPVYTMECPYWQHKNIGFLKYLDICPSTPDADYQHWYANVYDEGDWYPVGASRLPGISVSLKSFHSTIPIPIHFPILQGAYADVRYAHSELPVTLHGIPVAFPKGHTVVVDNPVWIRELWWDNLAADDVVEWDFFWERAFTYAKRGQFSRIGHMLQLEAHYIATQPKEAFWLITKWE